MRVWVYPALGRVQVVEEDTVSPEVVADIVASPIAGEALLSDALISELGLALEDVKKGLWRFRWEPLDRLRWSKPPKYWR